MRHSHPTTCNEAVDESGKQGLIIPVHLQIIVLSVDMMLRRAYRCLLRCFCTKELMQ